MNAAILSGILERKNLALFLGPDLSSDVTGLPSRNELCRELSKRHGLEEGLSLQEVAQRISPSGNRWELIDFLRSVLDMSRRTSSLLHQRIASFVRTNGIRSIITACYDKSLDLAFLENGVSHNLLITANDVFFLAPDRPTLIKVYGDIDRPDSLVVTERDHSELLHDSQRRGVMEQIRQVFQKETVLIIGYDLSDPDFRVLFDEIAASKFARKAFAVWPFLPEVEKQMWKDRGIVILDADPFGILTNADSAGSPTSAAKPKGAREIPLPGNGWSFSTAAVSSKDVVASNPNRISAGPPALGAKNPYPEVYVTYAWGEDLTTAGQQREEIVDRLCEAVRASGFEIGRDKDRMRSGDSIERFAQEISKAKRIVAVISAKSLHSTYCMVHELFSAYRGRCNGNRAEFQEQVIALVMDDAKAVLAQDLKLAQHWKEIYKREHRALVSVDPEHRSHARWSYLDRLHDMCSLLPDMLDAIKDIVMKRGFDQIVADGFKEVLDRLSPHQTNKKGD
jgi:hypothetical protein